MDLWLNTVGYAAAVAFAFEGGVSALAHAECRAKAIALFFLAALFAFDSFSWYMAATALASMPPHTYPWELHVIDVSCILAGIVAAIQFKDCELDDDARALDPRAALGLVALGVYCFGVTVYWCVSWYLMDENHLYWLTLRGAWHIGQRLSAFTIGTITLYTSIGAVVAALLWTKSRNLVLIPGSIIRMMWEAGARWLWCYEGRIWPSLACWLPLPVAIYVGAGPTADILSEDIGWPGWGVHSTIAASVAAAAIAASVGVWKAAPPVRAAVHESIERTRCAIEAAGDLLLG